MAFVTLFMELLFAPTSHNGANLKEDGELVQQKEILLFSWHKVVNFLCFIFEVVISIILWLRPVHDNNNNRTQNFKIKKGVVLNPQAKLERTCIKS